MPRIRNLLVSGSKCHHFELQMNQLINVLRSIVGARNVLTGRRPTRRYCKGYRYGDGDVLAVVRPKGLVEQWRTLKACIDADVIVICQAANTGLTGGSTPHGNDYDRPIVIINMLRASRIYLIDHGRQAICLPGATLEQLESRLRPIGREPHSTIGSSCIGASVLGGICNNSGGSLIRRGPAYTQFALFAQVGSDAVLRRVNHLGVALGNDPEEMLVRLDSGDFDEGDIDYTDGRWGSDQQGELRTSDLGLEIRGKIRRDLIN